MPATSTTRPRALRTAETLFFSGLAIGTAVLLGAFDPPNVCSLQPSVGGRIATCAALALMLASAASVAMHRRRKAAITTESA